MSPDYESASNAAIAGLKRQRERTINFKYLLKNKWLYFFLIPGFTYFIVFKYVPMFGIVIAFKDFSLVKGIWGSSWIGFDNFYYLFQSRDFFTILRNSLVLSTYQIIWGFPAPILVAIMLNEVRSALFKRISQTVFYLPHFISWVVLSGMIIQFLSPDNGWVNRVIMAMGGEPIHFLLEPAYFRSIIVSAEVWKELGWGTIIYLAAMTNIDPTLYESARMDGANRFQQIRHITIPSIMTTIIVLLILRIGNILDNGFEQVFLLYNTSTYSVADVFDTYTYRIGLVDGRLSFATAAGVFKAVVGFVLIVLANRLARRFGNQIW
ncbi:ABC transporter permease [Paenibacillus beijingensis]|uniref:Protein lplB n=1 Tax=Paenibacillus beijingensis TaxID=1126833 RepID=A0A0D5NGL6_9BACL|nr:sugar ABC transporter permease [Paenibacillus beijingensis]AJY74260.1 protein lplB [Paenibacillus beijingensis]